MNEDRLWHLEVNLTKFFDAAVLTVCSVSLAAIVPILI